MGLELEKLSKKSIVRAWKDQMCATPPVHPDLGGEEEAAVILNNAKDVLLGWIDGGGPDTPSPGANSPSPSPVPLGNEATASVFDPDEQAG
ncbi:MAG: hypothetical protein H6677_04675 [Candidatus Obscuribacterales bacterium]|nr:hypothetical protein [Cyanobacteria bacterium HKST-UBA01]MCB9467552.1 hypothetical protein [Candidatus Obscuribacterales bacterium]